MRRSDARVRWGLKPVKVRTSRHPAPDLSYTLLRYVNSAAFGFRSPITSVWRAITFLGQRGVRAGAAMIILADYGSDHPFDGVMTSVTRGRFCELTGQELRRGAAARICS